jgi:hypothetical protein
LQAGLSGAKNTGSGSGFGNLGGDISGYANTSTLDPALSAFISGLLNLGTNLSGLFVNFGSGSLRGSGGSPKASGGWSLGIDTNVDISEIPINLDGEIGLNVPLSASLDGPITIDAFSIPTIPGNINGTATLLVPPNLFGPAVIPLVSDIGIGAINVPQITISSTEPLLSGLIGGPDTTIPIHISGAIGPNNNGGNAKFSLTRTDTPGLGVNLHAGVAQTPIKLNGDIPVDVPFSADLADLTLNGFTIPGFNVTTSNWQVTRNLPTSSLTKTVYLNFEVPGTTLPVSDINVAPVTIALPNLTGRIGGPGAGIGLNLDAGLGPFTIDAPIGVELLPTPAISLDKVLISQIPFFANLGVTADIPVDVGASPLQISPITIPQITIGTNPINGALQGLVLQASGADVKTPPVASANIISGQYPCSIIGVCLALGLSPVINVGPISTDAIDIAFPADQALSLTIGGPGKGLDAGVTGALGPIVVSLANSTIEEFAYSYAGNAGVDLPIDGSTGDFTLQETNYSLPVQALLYQRTGYCLARVCTGMTISGSNGFVTYLNGGNPAGTALGPFPSPTPVSSSTLINDDLGGAIGPLTLLPSIVISQGIASNTPFSGSGTIGPIPLSSGG